MGEDGRERRRAAARAELVEAIEELGYPQEFGEVIAHELGGEQSMRRMASYLRRARPNSPEEIADELIAILEERRRWVGQKMSQQANDHLTAFYNRPRDPEAPES